ncbi:flagellar biosynthetic protein FliO [Bartonella sp. B17]
MRVWLSSQIGTSAANIVISLVLFIIMIVAIFAIIVFLYRLNIKNFNINRKKCPSRLTICDTITIDRTRRLILIRHDNTEHLLLIGGQKDIIVESKAVSTRTTHESIYQQKRNTQSTLTVTDITKNPKLTKEVPFFIDEVKQMYDDTSTPVMKQHLKDSAITAEIEGRQEPFLSVPVQKK